MEAPTEEKPEEKKWFSCHVCNMTEMYDFKGRTPPQNKNISFKEECYIMSDPFTAPEKKQFLLLGSDCSGCNMPVCQSTECSVFYDSRYCSSCALKDKNKFPKQMQSKIEKFET